MLFECSFSYAGNYFTLWNITNIVPIVSLNVPVNTSISLTISGGGSNGFTTLTLPVTQHVMFSYWKCKCS